MMIEIRGVLVEDATEATKWVKEQRKAAKARKTDIETAVLEAPGQGVLVIVWPTRKTIDA